MNEATKGGLQPPEGDGQSQGGAYPGQKRGRRTKHGLDRFLGHGGQSVQAYQGGDKPNATSEEEGSKD